MSLEDRGTMLPVSSQRKRWLSLASEAEWFYRWETGISGASASGNGTFKAKEERWIPQHEMRTR